MLKEVLTKYHGWINYEGYESVEKLGSGNGSIFHLVYWKHGIWSLRVSLCVYMHVDENEGNYFQRSYTHLGLLGPFVHKRIILIWFNSPVEDLDS